MRGGWLWAFTGLVGGLLSYLIYVQFDGSSLSEFYAVCIGILAQALVTGIAFLMLANQQRPMPAPEQA